MKLDPNMAREWLEPLTRLNEDRGLGHLAEIADAEAPHRFAGCPFQAWSLGEVLRLQWVVLADATARAAPPAQLDVPA